MRAFGCLLVLAVLAALAGEIWFAIWLGNTFEEQGGILASFLILGALSFIGYKIVRWRAKTLPMAMMSGNGGRLMASMVGGILLTFPGYITGALGLLMQLLPVQIIMAGLMQKLLATMMKQAMSKMAGGGMPGGFPGGMPGGMPGGAGGMPGGGIDPAQMMAAMQAMQKAQAQQQRGGGKKGAKTYDVQAERARIKKK